MSSVSSRSKANTVKSVGAPAAAGAFVVGAVFFGLMKLLSAGAKAAFKQTNKSKPARKTIDLKSVSQIRTETKPLKSATAAVNVSENSIETVKGQILGQIAGQPFFVTDAARLEGKIAALVQSKTMTEIETAKIDLISYLEAEHQRVFTAALVGACQKAALKIGFPKIETLPSRLASVVRFSATDSSGRTLVTEVSAPIGADVRVETEVVGVLDGSCNLILDAFDKALEEEGVRSQPPKRKYTGGVCETVAVRDFLAQKVKPTQTKSVQTKNFASSDESKRARRLNRQSQNQRQK